MSKVIITGLDWRLALINSSLKMFSNDVAALNIYSIKCYIFLNKQNMKLNFVIVQICCCHFVKTGKTDIENIANDSQKTFF